MEKGRFEVINESKFERLSKKELQGVKGGFCISCMKRSRKIRIGGGKSKDIYYTTPYGDRVRLPGGTITFGG